MSSNQAEGKKNPFVSRYSWAVQSPAAFLALVSLPPDGHPGAYIPPFQGPPSLRGASWASSHAGVRGSGVSGSVARGMGAQPPCHVPPWGV